MPLTRGALIGYDARRMFFKFTMMNGEHIIECEISSAALGDLAGDRWQTPQTQKQEAQFNRCRDQVEKIASDLFDAGKQVQSIRIFAKHLPRRSSSSK
jgi:hypothetical protein